jgi:xylose isomerase
LFEFFYTLRKNKWEGVWQLDQFPFREDCVGAAKSAIGFLKHIEGALDRLDFDAMRAAQAKQDAVAALDLARAALFQSGPGHAR